jgi:hypothetical protein
MTAANMTLRFSNGWTLSMSHANGFVEACAHKKGKPSYGPAVLDADELAQLIADTKSRTD